MLGCRHFLSAAIGLTLVLVAAVSAQAGPFSISLDDGSPDREVNPLTFTYRGQPNRIASAPDIVLASKGCVERRSCDGNSDALHRAGILQDRTGHFFLYDDGNELSMAAIFSRGQSGHVSAAITTTGLAGNPDVNLSVPERNTDFGNVWNTADGNFRTTFIWGDGQADQMVLSGLPNGAGDEWSLQFITYHTSGIFDYMFFMLDAPYDDGGRVIESFTFSRFGSFTISRTAEATASVSAPAGLIFPLAALGLIAVRRRLT